MLRPSGRFPPCRSPAAPAAFRSATSTASAATTPSTRRRWAATRPRSRRSSSPSRRMPWSRSCRRRSAASAIRWRRRTFITRSSSSWRSAPPACKLAPADALAIVWGYAVGLDMTRRDLQNDMREKKRPWDIGKSFADAAPIGPIHPVAAVGHPARGKIWLDVNGARRQQGDLADMIWDVAHTIAFLSQYYELLPGDLIFTGTPAGVGAVVAGDRLDGGIDGLGTLAVAIAPPSRTPDDAPVTDRYTPEFVERGYNNRAAVPDHPRWLAHYPESSAKARAALAPKLDLRYGPGPKETLDLFLPAGPRAGHVRVPARRLLARARQERLLVRRAAVRRARVRGRGRQLRPVSRRVRSRRSSTRPARGGVDRARGRRARRESRPHRRRRAFGGRTSRRDAVRDGLGGAGASRAIRSLGARVAVRRPRPRADGAVLVQRRFQARRARGGAAVAGASDAALARAAPARGRRRRDVRIRPADANPVGRLAREPAAAGTAGRCSFATAITSTWSSTTPMPTANSRGPRSRCSNENTQ